MGLFRARAGEALANEAVLNMSANLTGVVAYGGTVRFDSQAGALNASAQVNNDQNPRSFGPF